MPLRSGIWLLRGAKLGEDFDLRLSGYNGLGS